MSNITINYVWLGSNPLGPLEKFNIASWRAFGHEVNLYTIPFFGNPKRTYESLGITAEDATIFDLATILKEDDAVTDVNDPKKALSDTRKTLTKWLSEVPNIVRPASNHMDQIYNTVDVTKSYIGGTRKGIVIDIKVGPSPHLNNYIESFSKNFISYTRAGKTAENLPENQCMGTMQDTNELRLAYANSFNERMKALAEVDVKTKWFDKITGYHGNACIAIYNSTKQFIDVATQKEDGTPVGNNYPVGEPGGSSHGPFRVFKTAYIQSNQGGAGSNNDDNIIKDLAGDVLKKELPKGNNFTDKAKLAQEALPKKALW